MLRADFQSPLAVLVTDVEQWKSVPIPSSSPGDYGDANPNDIRAAITAGGWVKPVQKEAGTSTTWSGYPAVPGIRPEAFWHSPNAPHVLFRASAAYLLYPPPPTCGEQLAEAQTEIARLNAALEEAQQDLGAALADVERLTAALAVSQQNLAALDALLQSLVADLQNDFRVVFGDPTFVIPGATPNEQLQALVQALKGLERGPKLQVYRRLGGRLGM